MCGNDYKTPDGTGVRDFIHVLDLCRAHLLSLKAMDKGIKNHIFNLGNGQGFSVLDIIKSASVSLETNANNTPGLLKPIGDEDFQHVIMPMHLG